MSRFIENTFDIIWEINNTTFTLPIYHVHTAYKPGHDLSIITPPIQNYITVYYIVKDYWCRRADSIDSVIGPIEEFYVHLYYNGEQINNSNELLQSSINNYNNEYGAHQDIAISETLYNELRSGVTNVFTVKFKNSRGQTLNDGYITENRMTADGYIIRFENNRHIDHEQPSIKN